MDGACHIFVALLPFLYSNSIQYFMQLEGLREVLIDQMKESFCDNIRNIFIAGWVEANHFMIPTSLCFWLCFFAAQIKRVRVTVFQSFFVI